MSHQVITNFNAGELSPLMDSRHTLEKYRNGCRILENFTITPYGPVNRRPGTQYLGAAKYANTRCRLIGLNLSDSNRYVMEIGVGYIRFWANGSLLTNGGSPVEAIGVDYLGNPTGTTPHPYQEADLRGISIVTVNNVAYLAHANYPPMRLSHYSDTNWTIGEVPWSWPAMSSVNTTTTTITATTATQNTYTVSASMQSYAVTMNNPLTSITVTTGGSLYTTVPTVTISGGGGSGATAVANLSSGSVSGITITNPGSGYTSAPTIALTAAPSGGVSAQAVASVGAGSPITTAKVTVYGTGMTFVAGQQLQLSSDQVQTGTFAAQQNAILGGLVALSASSTAVTFAVPASAYIPSGNLTLSAPGNVVLTGTGMSVAAGQSCNLSGYGQFNALYTSATNVVFASNLTTAPAGTTLTVYTPPSKGTSVTLTASQGLFQTGHVGSYWQLDYINPTPVLNVNITGNTVSNPIAVYGTWSLQTWNYWSATISLQQSNDGVSNWQTIRTYQGNCDSNFSSTGTTSGLQYLRIVISNWTANAAGTPNASGVNARVMVTPTSPLLHGWVKINGVSGTPTVTNGISYYPTATATIQSTLGNVGVSTQTWYEGAFSAVQGYPNAVSLHESRVIFGGTNLSPTSIWGSHVNDFQNFLQGALDSDSFLFNLASTTGGRVQWMVSKQSLLIGTAQDEWLLSASSAPAAITPSNVIAQKQSHYGSANLPAMIINDTILYVQRQARKIREFIYTWQSQTWVSSDLTALAEQATRNYIVESAYQRVPDAIYWFVRGDGQLVSMTYEREQQVTGFSRHTTQGVFESVATINGNNNEDEVWVAVNRTINGSTVRYIERLATGQRNALDNADKSSWWYVDAGLKQTFGSPTKTITGLSHLNGMTVQVWADSAVGNVALNPATGTAYTVSGGSITLQQAASNVLVGLSYTSTICPERIAVDLQDGNSQGRKQNISKSNVKVYNSLAGEVSADAITWVPLMTRHTSDVMDSSPPAYNGWQRTYVTSNYDDVADFYIRQTLPVPLSVCAVALDWQATEQD